MEPIYALQNIELKLLVNCETMQVPVVELAMLRRKFLEYLL